MIESRWWAVAYANEAGNLGTLDLQLQDPEPFPIRSEFWNAMLDFVRERKRGALLALTPACEPFGSVLSGQVVGSVTVRPSVTIRSE